MDLIAGIDYGSKTAGTTAIAWPDSTRIHLTQSERKKDADQWLQNWVQEYQPQLIFLDAPLSLPGTYMNPEQYSNFFYREADQAVQAMSPMFLGGLTARAMQLKRTLERAGCTVREVYPGRLARQLGLDTGRYKKDNSYLEAAAQSALAEMPGYQLAQMPANWHQLDALLALCSGHRYQHQRADLYGSPEEGQIIV